MEYIIVLIICVASVEIFVRARLQQICKEVLKVSKNVVHIIKQNKISDHWKEKAVPAYALRIMLLCGKMLVTLLLIFSILFIADFFVSGILAFTTSLAGIIFSLTGSFLYLYVRRLFIK